MSQENPFTKNEIKAIQTARKALGMDEYDSAYLVIRRILALYHKPLNDYKAGRKLTIDFARQYKSTLPGRSKYLKKRRKKYK